MLLLVTLFGIVLLAVAVAAPPLREGATEGEGPIEAWPNGPTGHPGPLPMAAANGSCASGLRAGLGAAPRPAPDDGATRQVWASPMREGLGADASSGGRKKDCFRAGAALPGDDAGGAVVEIRAREGAALIADFDPAVEIIEIAYEGDAAPDLRFVETAGATEVLVDGVVVARMAGVTGLGPSHVSLIAA